MAKNFNTLREKMSSESRERSKILSKKYRVGRFAIWYDAEVNVYVGYCPALRLYSQGRTEEEAHKAIISAVKLYIIFAKNPVNRSIK